MGVEHNGLGPGDFNPHRTGVSAVDGSVPTNKMAGVNGYGNNSAIVECVLKSGTMSSVTLEARYWSDDAGTFLPAAPTADSATMTAPSQFIINHAGRRFFIVVTALAGAAPVLDINCAAQDDFRY